mmetsp:Transcript_33036/g.105420  ORF Transcript_33036/g.105420 Transcript_33036/m.105420 type:complete len:251 (+) Transcript_33036:487-1239(+)
MALMMSEMERTPMGLVEQSGPPSMMKSRWARTAVSLLIALTSLVFLCTAKKGKVSEPRSDSMERSERIFEANSRASTLRRGRRESLMIFFTSDKETTVARSPASSTTPTDEILRSTMSSRASKTGRSEGRVMTFFVRRPHSSMVLSTLGTLSKCFFKTTKISEREMMPMKTSSSLTTQRRCKSRSSMRRAASSRVLCWAMITMGFVLEMSAANLTDEPGPRPDSNKVVSCSSKPREKSMERCARRPAISK